jgi:UDP-N-acetylglucosamine 1-carboxyvinyltransferase
MEEIQIIGGNRLMGEVTIEGAKNAVLPIMAASLLMSEGTLTLTNVPEIDDVFIMQQILERLGVNSHYDIKEKMLEIHAAEEISSNANFDLISKMRASILVMGPILSRNKKVSAALPGGDAIGARPIDLHLKGFVALGAKTHLENGAEVAEADELRGTSIYLDFPSVGATQNILMAAVLADGVTVIENAAQETEIVDLANVLNKMGARVQGAGTEMIKVVGVEKLHGAVHRIVQDRIEAGTFMIAAALTNGDVLVHDAMVEHNRPLISKLREAGAQVIVEPGGIRVIGTDMIHPTNIKTMPHPGFPTDLQAPFSILMTQAFGASQIMETVFEHRFQHLEEMRKMNLNFSINSQVATIYGGNQLFGSLVHATDIRAAASLVLAGLVAKGVTRVDNLNHLDRGYYHFTEKLQNLGANVTRTGKISTSIRAKELV